MSKKSLWVIASISVLFGMGISVWSYYFVEYNYDLDSSSYSTVECREQLDSVNCTPLIDYNTSGFPLQFAKEDWSYDFNNKPFGETTIISVDESFSWILFAANSLLWTVPSFLLLSLAAKFVKNK